MRHEIFEAIESGDADRVRNLAHAAGERDADGVSDLLFAQYYGRDDLVDALRPRKGELDIFEAAALGDVDRLHDLLEADPGLVNAYAADGFFPLGLAAFFGHEAAVRLLLERGADPNQESQHAQIVVRPIHSAVADGGSVEIARLLIDAGADVNARRPDGGTALHTAAHEGNSELVELLLARGADASLLMQGRDTPSDVAARHGHADVAERLGGSR